MSSFIRYLPDIPTIDISPRALIIYSAYFVQERIETVFSDVEILADAHAGFCYKEYVLALEILNRAELVRPVHLLGTLADELLTCAKVIFGALRLRRSGSRPVLSLTAQSSAREIPLQFADIEVYADKAGYAIAVLDIRGRRKKIAPVAGLELYTGLRMKSFSEEFIQEFVGA